MSTLKKTSPNPEMSKLLQEKNLEPIRSNEFGFTWSDDKDNPFVAMVSMRKDGEFVATHFTSRKTIEEVAHVLLGMAGLAFGSEDEEDDEEKIH